MHHYYVKYRARNKGMHILLRNSQEEQLSKSRKKFLATTYKPWFRALYSHVIRSLSLHILYILSPFMHVDLKNSNVSHYYKNSNTDNGSYSKGPPIWTNFVDKTTNRLSGPQCNLIRVACLRFYLELPSNSVRVQRPCASNVMAKITDVRASRNITEIYYWCNFAIQFSHSFLRRSHLVVGAVKVSPVVRHFR